MWPVVMEKIRPGRVEKNNGECGNGGREGAFAVI